MINEENYVDLVEDMKKLRYDFLKATFLDTQSPEIDQLASALAKAQAEFEPILNEDKNPFFKSRYSKLDRIVKGTREALTNNGLSVMQPTYYKDGISFLRTVLMHSSGQWTSSISMIDPPKKDIQTLGSYRTYLRRYDYASMIGAVTTDDIEDDDGERAMQRQANTYISAPQFKQLQSLLNRLSPGYEDRVKKYASCTSLDKLSSGKFEGCKMWLENEIKNMGD